MNIKALVFDMDGTLINTLEDLADSTNFALKQHSYPINPTDDYRFFVGSGARNLIKRALPSSDHAEDIIDEVLETYKKHYATNWRNKSRLYAGIGDALNQAVDQKLKLAVLTNKPQEFADQCAAHFLSDWPWEKVQGQVDGVPHKPDTAMPTLVNKALDVQPNEVLYFGDSDVDMQTAKNIGYKAIGVTWGFRPERELRKAGAEFIIHEPAEILGLIDD